MKNFNSALRNSIKKYITEADFFCTNGSGPCPFRRALLSNALQKELVIAPFKVDCFQAVFSEAFDFLFTPPATKNKQF